ncbi:MAG: glycoside hydrolase family 16 protein [Bacteroidetes bacterium]|nr:glycoside hydrolase family 16 protein [Bacteroidota bacterium]
MKNLYYLLLAILIIYLDDFDLKAQCTLDRTDWGSPVFFDEFDTYSDISELDTKWSLVYYGNPLLSPVHTLIENDEIEYYDANQFELYDGLLKIKATHLPYGETIEYFGKELFYKSGLLRAKYPLTECLDYKEDGIGFKYGLFEIRCKMPKPEQKGMWPAFWLQWAGKEIDIFELSVTTEHLSNYYTMNIHDNSAETGNACNFGLLYQGEDNLYDNFHTYSIVWSPPVGLIPAKVTYFFDDKEIKTIDYFIPQGCPLDLIVNLAVKEGATSIEGELIVDYVRVYEKTDYSEYKTEEDWFQAPLDWSWNNTFNSNHTNNNIVYSESSNRIYYVDDLNRIRFFKENSGEWVNIKVIPDDSPLKISY